jgi:eight-cysteine-cluster-containing protein
MGPMSKRAALLLLTCAFACERRPPPTPGWPGRPEATPGAVTPDEDGPGDPPGVDEADPIASSKGERVPAIADDHPLFARVEGDGFRNDCKVDDECKVGGCSGEVCSAEPSVASTCDATPMRFPDDAACGCVEGQCRWWSASGKRISGGPVSTEPPQPKSSDPPRERVVDCGERTCKPGQECVEYFGIAGPSGPMLRSCEWRCDAGCPGGTRCVTIADGPGKVCR